MQNKKKPVREYYNKLYRAKRERKNNKIKQLKCNYQQFIANI